MNRQHESGIAPGVVICSLICMLFSGCGSESAPSSLVGQKVVWEGSIDDRPQDKAVFDRTIACLNQHFGIQEPKPHPRLVLINDQFMVQGQGPYDGYILFEPNIMYVRNSGREPWIVCHEAIHWMYQVGDSLHGTEPYQACQQ